MNAKTRTISVAVVLALVLVVGIFWGLGSGNGDDEQVATDAPTTSSTTSTTNPTSTTSTDPGSAPAPSGGGGSGSGSGSPAGETSAATPSIGAVTLTSARECVSIPGGTGCDEIVVPQLFVSVVDGSGSVTTFVDTGSSTQLSLVPGTPLTISQPAASGVDPADINRIEVRLFEHMTGRGVQVSVEDNGSLAVNVPTSTTSDGIWTLRFTVDGLV